MAKAYYLMKALFDNQKILATKKVGKRYVHFTLPNGLPLKITHKQFMAWNGDKL